MNCLNCGNETRVSISEFYKGVKKKKFCNHVCEAIFKSKQDEHNKPL